MTKQELADYFKKPYQSIENGFLNAQKHYSELITRKTTNGHVTIDYTLEEVLKILPYMPFKVSKIETELLKESFVYRESRIIKDKETEDFDPMISGMKKFIKETKKHKYRPCCENCIYLSAKPFRTSRLKPFCSFYNFFMHRKKVDIFHDYCRTFEYQKRDPMIWYKENAPVEQVNFKDGVDTETVIEDTILF